MVTVAPKVKLEVLDWGGSGEPVVFLAGLGNSAHVFDDFAPQFTDGFHVLGITRRGYGASSQPPSGYDSARLAADIKAVLDTLHLTRVVLVGHSIAGDELTKFASTYPDRIAKLVYLDAAHDRTGLPALFQNAPIPPSPPMLAADSASPAAARAYMERSTGVLVPEGELSLVRNYMLGSLLGSLENIFSHADKFKNIYFFGLDYNYYDRYTEVIKSISSVDVMQMAKKYLDTDNFYKVIVGKY